MTIQDVARSNFTSGQISRKLGMRYDVGKRANGCDRLLNMIPLAYGGAMRRPATRYVARTRDDGPAALIEFEFNAAQSYILAFGDRSIRFFADRGQLVAGAHGGAIRNGGFDSAAGWTQTGVTITGGVARFAQAGVLRQAVRLAEPTARVVLAFKVDGRDLAADRLTLKVGSVAHGGDLLSTRTFAIGWHCVSFAPGSGVTTIHLTFTRSSGAPELDDVRLIDDAPIEIGAPYAADHVRDLYTTQSADILYLAHGDHRPYVVKRRGGYSWSIEAYAMAGNRFSGANQFPAVVEFHEARLVYAGTNQKPDTIWFSKKNAFATFTRPRDPKADDALTVTLNARKPHRIRWMISADDLRVGTSGAEWRVFGQNSEAITPANIDARITTTRRSAPHQPVKIDDQILFLERTRRKLRELSYVFESDGYKARDLNLLADEITARSRIAQVVYQQEPFSFLWARLDDGRLLSLTYDRDQEVVAWAEHQIGGRTDGRDYGVVESIASIPSPDGRQDDLWLIVRRVINGAARRYVEHLDDVFEPTAPDQTRDMRFVDAGVSYSGAAVDRVTGADHLEGEVVQVLADGAVHPDRRVAGGAVDLQDQASRVHLGLAAPAEIVDLPGPILRVPRGVARGAIQRAKTIRLDLLDSFEGVDVVYRDAASGEERCETLTFRDETVPLDRAAPLFTGLHRLTYPGPADRNLHIIIRQANPTALHVRGWVAQVEAFE